MLPREKKRAAWSLAIGLVAAGGVAVGTELQARRLDNRTRAELAKCEAENAERKARVSAIPPAKRGYWDSFVVECDPADFVPDKREPYVRGQDLIADLEHDARATHDSWKFRAPAVFAVFCLPLLWYLFLDRIREISAAISGRDRRLTDGR
jgi:hypothetical protein